MFSIYISNKMLINTRGRERGGEPETENGYSGVYEELRIYTRKTRRKLRRSLWFVSFCSRLEQTFRLLRKKFWRRYLHASFSCWARSLIVVNLRALSFGRKMRGSWKIGMDAKLGIVLPFGKLLAVMPVEETHAMVNLCAVALFWMHSARNDLPVLGPPCIPTWMGGVMNRFRFSKLAVFELY